MSGAGRRIAAGAVAALALCALWASSARAQAARGDAATLRALYDGQLRPDALAGHLARMDRLAPEAVVPRGGGVRALPPSTRTLGRVEIRHGGRRFDLADYLSLNRVSGLIVVKDGRVVLEDHELGTTAATRWASFSMAKAITSTLMGVAVADGLVRLEEPVVRYLPALRGSAYEGVSVRQLLQMSSGVAWREEYEDPASDRRRLLEAQLSGEAGAELRLMAGLHRAAPPGTRWGYNSGETFLVADVIRAATGLPLARYLSERIWSRAGMEGDAGWWLQSNGVETGGTGFSATLRDYARFGLFVLADGVVDGRRIVPPGWFAEATRPATSAGQRPDLGYGYQWWLFPAGGDPIHAGAFMASGIFGQAMYLSPRERLVIVVLSARSKPVTSTVIPDATFLAAVAKALR